MTTPEIEPANPVYRRQAHGREAWVKKEVKKILNRHGLFFYMPSAAIYGRAGASDFFTWIPPTGHGVLIETKADRTSEMTPLQKKFFVDAGRMGVSCIKVHRGNLDQLEPWLLTIMETFK